MDGQKPCPIALSPAMHNDDVPECCRTCVRFDIKLNGANRILPRGGIDSNCNATNFERIDWIFQHSCCGALA
jgi:hypothetical protein